MAKAGGAQTIDFSETDVYDELMALTDNRGPDSCIDAVGCEAAGHGATDATLDKVKAAAFLATDRACASSGNHVLSQSRHRLHSGRVWLGGRLTLLHTRATHVSRVKFKPTYRSRRLLSLQPRTAGRTNRTAQIGPPPAPIRAFGLSTPVEPSFDPLTKLAAGAQRKWWSLGWSWGQPVFESTLLRSFARDLALPLFRSACGRAQQCVAVPSP